MGVKRWGRERESTQVQVLKKEYLFPHFEKLK
jgi:hypothetical protein